MGRPRRRRRVRRKPEDTYAVLAPAPAELDKRVRRRGSYRDAADFCGHSSHTHIYRLCKGETKTTSVRTADLLEAYCDASGLLFARMSVGSGKQSAA